MPNHVHLIDVPESEALRRHERTGTPFGDDDFITRLESALGRSMRRQESGPKGSMQDLAN
jgi:hypothetical protein